MCVYVCVCARTNDTFRLFFWVYAPVSEGTRAYVARHDGMDGIYTFDPNPSKASNVTCSKLELLFEPPSDAFAIKEAISVRVWAHDETKLTIVGKPRIKKGKDKSSRILIIDAFTGQLIDEIHPPPHGPDSSIANNVSEMEQWEGHQQQRADKKRTDERTGCVVRDTLTTHGADSFLFVLCSEGYIWRTLLENSSASTGIPSTRYGYDWTLIAGQGLQTGWLDGDAKTEFVVTRPHAFKFLPKPHHGLIVTDIDNRAIRIVELPSLQTMTVLYTPEILYPPGLNRNIVQIGSGSGFSSPSRGRKATRSAKSTESKQPTWRRNIEGQHTLATWEEAMIMCAKDGQRLCAPQTFLSGASTRTLRAQKLLPPPPETWSSTTCASCWITSDVYLHTKTSPSVYNCTKPASFVEGWAKGGRDQLPTSVSREYCRGRWNSGSVGVQVRHGPIGSYGAKPAAGVVAALEQMQPLELLRTRCRLNSEKLAVACCES